MPKDAIDFTEVYKAILRAETATLSIGAMNVLRFSTGKYNKRKLQKHNHPYGLGSENRFGPRGNDLPFDRRGMGQGEGVPYGDSAIINKQSGLFAASWTITEPTLVGDNLISVIDNMAPYADDLAIGIPGLTIPRLLIEAVAEKIDGVRENNLIMELSRV